MYALAYVSIAVAISAATASRSRAMGGAIGFFFAFNVGWNFLPVGPAYMAEFVLEELGLSYADEHIEFIFSLSPTGAYLNGLGLVFPDAAMGGGQAANGFDAFYVQDWFMLVLLAGWVVVPLVAGIWRFRRADLG